MLAQPAAPPAFDVASIKTSPRESGGPGIPGENIRALAGSLTMRHVTVKECIEWAYRVFDYQVSGPDWIESEHYDIAAKAAAPAQDPELRAMLQALLSERFHLTFHRQTKEMNVYALSVGKNGPKFRESAADGESSVQPDPKSMTVDVRKVPLSLIIDPLSRLFQTPVVDLTGLSGRYDVTINIAKYIPQTGERIDPVYIIQTALEEELGLKLDRRKMPVDLLIIDHADKAPTDN